VSPRLHPAPRLAEANPFARHPLRRYAFAWEQLASRSGRHLDLGCGTGEFVGTLGRTSALDCAAGDPHAGYLAELRERHPEVRAEQVAVHGPLHFGEAEFDSVSLLDVLEHVPDEGRLLDEVWRVLVPGGLLVVTVPGRHVFSFLDPDNAKFRWPRLHRLVYSARFGRRVWVERFADLSDGLRGDMSVDRDEHTNYRASELVALLRAHGFEPLAQTGANLFWRWLQIPSLLGGRRLRALCDRAIWVDGRLFKSANLFMVARRIP
jgi:SAM-dependent methyltransferase